MPLQTVRGAGCGTLPWDVTAILPGAADHGDQHSGCSASGSPLPPSRWTVSALHEMAEQKRLVWSRLTADADPSSCCEEDLLDFGCVVAENGVRTRVAAPVSAVLPRFIRRWMEIVGEMVARGGKEIDYAPLMTLLVEAAAEHPVNAVRRMRQTLPG